MNAELITTGTEILLGEIVDTNAAWMARRLKELGVNLYYKTTVGDNLDRIAAVMRQALGRSDVVLVSGGLGPTVDDVTRDAAALATDRQLVLHQGSLEHMETIFARWGRSVQDNNRRQAFLPDGAIPIYNPVGTAPGFAVEVARNGTHPALLICLPGVPREMMHLMQNSVEPMLAERLGADRVYLSTRTLRTVGLGESVIDQRIDDLMHLSNPTVGLAAHFGQVDVRVTGRAGSPANAQSMTDEVADEVRRRLGFAVYGEGDQLFEAAVAGLLRERGFTLALLESNTGGELAERFHSLLNGQDPLVWDKVIRSTSELGEGGPGEIVSEAGARWVAEQVRLAVASVPDSDVVTLAVCGTSDSAAGPYGAYRGETFVAVGLGDALTVKRIDVGGVDELARRWSGNGALNELRLRLMTASGSAPGTP
ncbi:MAG: CinA family nicotinamide mononucleotide deamidase-related protein [Anaerolineae bacterium]|nr:CinA family nicotinamide mononucleotide deamidase-related protein [Anaerolineae bacterium]